VANNTYALPGETVVKTYRTYTAQGVVTKSFQAAPYPFKGGGTVAPPAPTSGQLWPPGH
jgi:hypothetical protein